MSTLTLPVSGQQQREAQVIEFPEDAGDSNVIELRAVPYDTWTELWTGVHERFAAGAFARAAGAPGRVKLHYQHGGPLIGCAREIRDAADGLYTTMRFSQIGAAQEARTLAQEGVLDGASILFRVMDDYVDVERRDDGTIWITHRRAHLMAVDLVSNPAYESAGVLAVRDQKSAEDQARAEQERQAAAEAAAQRRAEAIERLRALGA